MGLSSSVIRWRNAMLHMGRVGSLKLQLVQLPSLGSPGQTPIVSDRKLEEEALKIAGIAKHGWLTPAILAT
jgi:hypothetical protein